MIIVKEGNDYNIATNDQAKDILNNFNKNKKYYKPKKEEKVIENYKKCIIVLGKIYKKDSNDLFNISIKFIGKADSIEKAEKIVFRKYMNQNSIMLRYPVEKYGIIEYMCIDDENNFIFIDINEASETMDNDSLELWNIINDNIV